MKISYNWLKQYIDTDLTPEEVGEILTNTGLEVEGIETVEAVRGGLKGVVVGHVVEMQPHPNADRLNLTKVDVGGDDLLPIVCGAPNVDKGQKVLVATVGTELFPIGADKEFKIKKAKIRGEESQGMICAEDELGIGESHDGIMVLPESAKVGQDAAEFLQLESDYIFEIGLTPNRTDAFCHFGVARDLAAFLRQENKVAVQSPDLSAFQPERTNGQIKVVVEAKEACPRYSGLLIEGLEVKPSPEWLQKRLRGIGLTPKNNVVDITNFVLHELGQPLHAFDADKISGNEVRVKHCAKGTKFTTLDGEERELAEEDLMICDANQPMCIAGTLGGTNSGVTENTTRVFLESACFDATSVRKTAKRHQVNTDASFRFERGVDPNGAIAGLKRAAMLITEIAGGAVTTDIIDHYPNPVDPVEIDFSLSRCNALIGQTLEEDRVMNILGSLDIEIIRKSDDNLRLAIPTYRVDVTREADVVEEILRIYGYDHVEIPEKVNASMNVSGGVSDGYLRNLIADHLVSNGFIQMMSNSLSSSASLEKLGAKEFSAEHNVKILNALSSELDVMRQTLLVNMLDAVALNRNHKNADLRFFEFGNVYRYDQSGNDEGEQSRYQEDMHLAMLLTGSRYPENWSNPNRGVRFFDLRNELDILLQRLGAQNRCRFETLTAEYIRDGQSIRVGKVVIGHIGVVDPKVARKFDIDQDVYFAVINWSQLKQYLGDGKIKYQPISKYPAVRRDFSLLLDDSVTFEAIERLALKTEKKLLKEVGLFDVYDGDKLEKGKKSYAVRFQMSADRTLKDAEVDAAMGRIRTALEKELGATLR